MLISFSAPSSACTRTANIPEQASGWPPCSASSTAMADASGRKAKKTKGQPFISHWSSFEKSSPGQERWDLFINIIRKQADLLDNKFMLLVEDNPKDVILAQRALKRANIANDLIVVTDGVEALEYLLGKDG